MNKIIRGIKGTLEVTFAFLLIIIVIIFSLYFIDTHFTNKNDSTTVSNSNSFSSVQPGKSVTLKEPLTFGTSESDLDKYIKFIGQNNQGAIQDMYLRNEIVRLPSNSKLNIVNSSVLTVQVEYNGQTYYTKADVLKDFIE